MCYAHSFNVGYSHLKFLGRKFIMVYRERNDKVVTILIHFGHFIVDKGLNYYLKYDY